MHLNIVHQDDDYVVIDKPSGLLVHRTQLDAHATEFALQLLRDQLDQNVYLCHRLDRPTCGLLLFALNPTALRFAQNEFAERRVHKTYHAIVRGWADDHGHIDSPLRSEDNPNRIDEAETTYRCLARSELKRPIGRYATARFSLLELKPVTGRKHQLRRHMAHIRHPILGDTRHGDGAQNRFIRQHFDCQRLLLRAMHLEIAHPHSNKRIDVTSTADSEFTTFARALKLNIH